MIYDKEQLKELLKFIDDLIVDPENEWFAEDLRSKFEGDNINIASSTISFDEFVKFQRKIFKVKAREFYKSIQDIQLKSELERDFQEMMWWRLMNNIERQYLFAYYQIENILNHYILERNAFEKIKINSEKYVVKFSDSFEVRCMSYFFSKDSPNDIEKISSIQAKIAFWCVEEFVKDWVVKNNSIIINLVQIRNLLSHRNSKANKIKILIKVEDMKKSDDSYFGFLMNFLRKIRDTVI